MSTPDPLPRIHEQCSCGSSIEAQAEDAREVVQEWRTGHPHADRADRRTGTGFAVTQTASVPRQTYGHNRLDVRT